MWYAMCKKIKEDYLKDNNNNTDNTSQYLALFWNWFLAIFSMVKVNLQRQKTRM